MQESYSGAYKKSATKRKMSGRGAAWQVTESPERKLGLKIDPQPNGCWLWLGNADRYHKTRWEGRVVSTYRLVYEILFGEIPDGHHLHHECQTPGCVNPAHLLPLTPSEHKARHKELA